MDGPKTLDLRFLVWQKKEKKKKNPATSNSVSGKCSAIFNLSSPFYFCSMKSPGCNCFPPCTVLGFLNQAYIETGFFFYSKLYQEWVERVLLNSQSCFQSLHSSPSLDIRDSIQYGFSLKAVSTLTAQNSKLGIRGNHSQRSKW